MQTMGQFDGCTVDISQQATLNGGAQAGRGGKRGQRMPLQHDSKSIGLLQIATIRMSSPSQVYSKVFSITKHNSTCLSFELVQQALISRPLRAVSGDEDSVS